MFRDDAQAFRAIRLLLARLGIEGLWSETGPTTNALRLRDERDAPLSADKRTLLLAAWSLWSPAALGVALRDVVHGLDRGSCLALCSLIVACTSGTDAIDAWIEAAEPAAPKAAPPVTAEAESVATMAPSIFADWPTLEVLSVRYAARVLKREHGNKSRAALVLGVDWRTLSRLAAPSPLHAVGERGKSR